jgi:hypothetical protein
MFYVFSACARDIATFSIVDRELFERLWKSLSSNIGRSSETFVVVLVHIRKIIISSLDKKKKVKLLDEFSAIATKLTITPVFYKIIVIVLYYSTINC